MYRILEHTADIRLFVENSSWEGLFRDALLGMMEILAPEEPASETRSRAVSLTAPDATTLLVDFLNEALSLAHTEREAYAAVTFSKLTETECEAELRGNTVRRFSEDIKAVTYHEAHVRKNEKGQWETVLVFDI